MKNKLLDILVVAPLTDEGKVVLQQAEYLQKILSCRIFVLNVIPPISFFKRLYSSRLAKESVDESLKRLTSFVSDYFKGKIPKGIILKIRMGNLVSTLIKQTKKKDFLFLILKRSVHKKGISSLLEQSEIDKIISRSHCPVMTINQEATQRDIKNILIPIDICERTKKRLLWASMFAKNTHAKIQIVSALNINIDKQKSLALKNAEKIKSMLVKRGIKCDVEILKTHKMAKHQAVLTYITENKPDFIIIRKHQAASTFKNSIGDFAKEIIHKSMIPVFTVSQSQHEIAKILP